MMFNNVKLGPAGVSEIWAQRVHVCVRVIHDKISIKIRDIIYIYGYLL